MISHHRNFNDITIAASMTVTERRHALLPGQNPKYFYQFGQNIFSFCLTNFSLLPADLKHSTRRENLFGRKFISRSGASFSLSLSRIVR